MAEIEYVLSESRDDAGSVIFAQIIITVKAYCYRCKMKELDSLDRRILFELIKNSRRSDRELARTLGVSQPTITRRRAGLEKYFIEGYTAIPKWEELGYELFVMTFIKIKSVIASKERYDAIRKRGIEWLMKQPNIVMAGGCRGMGVDSFMISFHKSYSDYDEFMVNYKLELADTIDDVQSVLVNLVGKELVKPLHLKYLTEAK